MQPLTLKFIEHKHIAQTLWMNNLYLLERWTAIEKYFIDVILKNTLVYTEWVGSNDEID